LTKREPCFLHLLQFRLVWGTQNEWGKGICYIPNLTWSSASFFLYSSSSEPISSSLPSSLTPDAFCLVALEVEPDGFGEPEVDGTLSGVGSCGTMPLAFSMSALIHHHSIIVKIAKNWPTKWTITENKCSDRFVSMSRHRSRSPFESDFFSKPVKINARIYRSRSLQEGRWSLTKLYVSLLFSRSVRGPCRSLVM
jgi:hypothetical protein